MPFSGCPSKNQVAVTGFPHLPPNSFVNSHRHPLRSTTYYCLLSRLERVYGRSSLKSTAMPPPLSLSLILHSSFVPPSSAFCQHGACRRLLPNYGKTHTGRTERSTIFPHLLPSLMFAFRLIGRRGEGTKPNQKHAPFSGGPRRRREEAMNGERNKRKNRHSHHLSSLPSSFISLFLSTFPPTMLDVA